MTALAPSTTPRRALLSVTDKTGLIDFARGLAALGIELLSTGGTRRVLEEAQISVVPLEDFTGMPEMLDGRVKTLHPKVHAGLLARRDDEAHLEAMLRNGFGFIDLLVVNLYDFQGARSRTGSTEDHIIEAIDVGGPAMLRAAAKNHAFVLPVVDPSDYPEALARLREGVIDRTFRRAMAAKVYRHTSRYDHAIAEFLTENRERTGEQLPASGQGDAGGGVGDAGAGGDSHGGGMRPAESMHLIKVMDLRYGENPHQTAAFYRSADERVCDLAAAAVLQGKELSYNNLLDLDAALGLAIDLGGHTAVFIKHNNPCGAARAGTLAEAIVAARAVDTVSAFGAVIALHGVVDEAAASVLTESFVEACVAFGYSPEALNVLGKKKNLRVVSLAEPFWTPRPRLELRTIRGGLLLQDADVLRPPSAELDDARVVTKRPPTEAERQALAFAWTVAKHVRSNAIVFSATDRVVAVGAGQMSRIDSVRLCGLKAASPLRGTVAASDAFFPFRDGLDALAEAGASAVVQPGGSVRDTEVISAADEHGLAMLFTGIRHFRH